MLSDEQLTVAIDDARARHAAVAELVYFNDQQAMALLSVYLTIGTVTASGAVAALDPESFLPPPVGVGLLAASVVLILGAIYCFRAMRKSPINLPGRDPDFWLWALEQEKVDFADLVRRYLTNLQTKAETNRMVSDQIAIDLAQAKLCGVMVPAVALVAGGLFYLLRSGVSISLT